MKLSDRSTLWIEPLTFWIQVQISIHQDVTIYIIFYLNYIILVIPCSSSGTSVSIGGSSSPHSRRKAFARLINCLKPCSSFTDDVKVFRSSLCSLRKSWIRVPKAVRRLRERSSTSRVTRFPGTKKDMKTALIFRSAEIEWWTVGGGLLVPRVRGGRSGLSSASSRLLRELLLSKSLRDGTCLCSRISSVSLSSFSSL